MCHVWVHRRDAQMRCRDCARCTVPTHAAHRQSSPTHGAVPHTRYFCVQLHQNRVDSLIRCLYTEDCKALQAKEGSPFERRLCGSSSITVLSGMTRSKGQHERGMPEKKESSLPFQSFPPSNTQFPYLWEGWKYRGALPGRQLPR